MAKVLSVGLIVCLVSIEIVESFQDSEITKKNDLRYLSELPLDKLLKVKKSLQEMSSFTSDENNEFYDDSLKSRSEDMELGNFSSRALPLRGFPNRKTYQLEKSEPWEEQKPSKVQTVFQLSITALAFLAFGGYLLCMIVQAIKSKGTTYYHPSLMPMTSATLKKKRPSYGRKRRDTEGNQTGGPSPDELYKALITAAEGYVKFKHIEL